MFLMNLIACMMLTAVVPLTDVQRAQLATAHDGGDHREPAFEALLDNVRQWMPGIGDAPIRLHPDLDAMVAEPEAYRGQLYEIVGRLQQQTRIDQANEGVVEWFIRDEQGRPILTYVVGVQPDHAFRDGEQVQIVARFYKRVDAVARDGKVHQYPAFVGVFSTRVIAGDERWLGLWAVAIPVVVMFVLFLLLLIYVRRGRPAVGARRSIVRPVVEALAEVDDPAPLPDDPAQALAELRRRAEATER